MKNIQDFFDYANIKYPNLENLKCFVQTIKKSKNQMLTLFTPCCPDYSYEILGKNKYSFNFKKLNSGYGLVNKRLKREIKKIHDYFKSEKIRFRHIIAFGDFEAFSQKNLDKVNLSKEEFLLKLKKSQKKLRNKFKNCKTDKLFTDYFGGEKIWEKKRKFFYNKLVQKNYFGKSNLNEDKLNLILQARLKLYKKWYLNVPNVDFSNVLMNQAAEYATMGHLLKKKFKNVLIIGADHEVMGNFYKISCNISYLYIKKNYET